MFRNIFLFLFLATVFFGIVQETFAGEAVSFDAAVSHNQASVGSSVRLVLTIHGAQGADAPELPAIDGADVRYVGPSTQITVVNGQYATTQSFTYRLIPLKEGRIIIPPVEMSIQGQVYRTQTITLEVGAAQANAPSSQNGLPADLSSRVKLLMMTPKPRVYWHETLPVAIRLYVNGVDLKDITFPAIAGTGFEVLGFAQPKRFEETQNGVRYQVIEFQAAIVPTRTGALMLGPTSLDAAVPVKADRSEQGSFFDDDFFRGFFGAARKQPIRISAEALQLEILSLPEEGRPRDFSGAVGQFDVAAEAAPASVKVGDPVTLRLTVKGNGDVKDVKFPSFKPEGFKAYDPQTKSLENGFLIEQVLIPLKAESAVIPPVSFNYFDPGKGQYVVVEKGPFPLQVAALQPGEEFKAVAFSGAASSLVENFGKDIIFIKDSPGTLIPKSKGLVGEWGFWFAWVVYLNLWGALFMFRRYQLRLLRDPALARRSRAAFEAHKRIKVLKTLTSRENPRFFCDELQHTLEIFLGDMLGFSPGEIASGDFLPCLSDKGIPDDLTQQLRKIITTCDAVRFASSHISPEDMQALLAELTAVVDGIERRCP